MALTFPVSGYRSLATGYADVRTALGDVSVFWRHCVAALAVRARYVVAIDGLFHSVVTALPAGSPAGTVTNAEVIAAKRMPIGAVCFGSALPTPKVFFQRYGLQMLWVAACAVTAKVVDLEAIWNRAFKNSVRVTMNQPSRSVFAEYAVPGTGDVSGPAPALIGRQCFSACFRKGVEDNPSHPGMLPQDHASFNRSAA